MLCADSGGERPCGHCAPCRKVSSGVHPDVTVISGPGEGKPITVDQVRALRSDAYIRPNEGERKIYLLEQADRMNQSAQNAMLKLLEEGPAYAVFLLLAENGGGLLQTVRSRCEELDLVPVPPAEAERWLSVRFPDQDPAAVRRAALECQGLLGRGVELLEGGGEAAERIRRHRALRAGKGFSCTVERPRDLAGWAPPAGSAVLLEDLGNLAANELFSGGAFDPEGAYRRIRRGLDRLSEGAGHLVVVSGDLFRDGVDYPPETGAYLDLLARLHRDLAARADRVVEVVCGIPVVWKGEAP